MLLSQGPSVASWKPVHPVDTAGSLPTAAAGHLHYHVPAASTAAAAATTATSTATTAVTATAVTATATTSTTATTSAAATAAATTAAIGLSQSREPV